MSVVLISGACGLVGSESALFFGKLGFDVVGIDNDMRALFFGKEASTRSKLRFLQSELGAKYLHHETDIRDLPALKAIFQRYGKSISLVIHTAAQPSHDWAARDPLTDFSVNATGTVNMLELTRAFAANAPFVFTSTNKVYGDRPNILPLKELSSRWELPAEHALWNGIPEDFAIDHCLHSVFGASKVAADIMVQEYGRYFQMPTVCFRGGCLTGPNHSGAELHGFLAYLMKCTVTRKPYKVFGYGGKQVRDNIHSKDLVNAFYEFFKAPRVAEVYNIGGGRESNCSLVEAVTLAADITGVPLATQYVENNRVGDHIWWISDLSRFKAHYPEWRITHDVRAILEDIFVSNVDLWQTEMAETEIQQSALSPVS